VALPCGLVQRGVPALHVAVELRAAGAEQQLDLSRGVGTRVTLGQVYYLSQRFVDTP